jgi:hypothetical protein
MAVEREKDKAKVIEAEIRRIQARVQKKKENERKRLAEEKLWAAETQREIKKQEEAKAVVASADVWCSYESRWDCIGLSSEPLTFRTIPWPLATSPSSTASIIPVGIVAFLLSPLHSEGQTRKDRIRSALRRWHPDRFNKVLERVVDEDKKLVQEGSGIVARSLNELMERENRVSRCESI